MCVDDKVPDLRLYTGNLIAANIVIFMLIQMLSMICPLYQMVAKKSQEAKNDTAKLKNVQDQASSSIDVKKSLYNLFMKIRGSGDMYAMYGIVEGTCACHAPPQPY